MSRLYLLFFLFSACWLDAQNPTLGMQVVASAGGSGAQGNYAVAWTVGEPVIQTVRNQDYIVTQGFHQPDIFGKVATRDPLLAALNIRLLPNPATEQFHLVLDGLQGQTLEVFVFDAYGKRMSGPVAVHSTDTVVNCADWPSGVYFLSLRNPARRTSADMKLIKL